MCSSSPHVARKDVDSKLCIRPSHRIISVQEAQLVVHRDWQSCLDPTLAQSAAESANLDRRQEHNKYSKNSFITGCILLLVPLPATGQNHLVLFLDL